MVLKIMCTDAPINRTNIIRADKKMFYFSENEVSDIRARNRFCLVNMKWLLFFQMDWSNAHGWCARKRMRLVSLKTLSQIKAVNNELSRRSFGIKFLISN
jgi:hypothetical protein